MDMSVAGIPIEGDNDLEVAIGAVVVIKGLDSDGDVAYWSRATDGVSLVEAVGMASTLLDDLLEARRRHRQQE